MNVRRSARLTQGRDVPNEVTEQDGGQSRDVLVEHDSPTSHGGTEGEGSTNSSRRTRGYNRVLELLKHPTPINIEENTLGQPICKEETVMSRLCGTIARDASLAPIDIHDWRLLPEEKKLRMIEGVTEYPEMHICVCCWMAVGQ